MEISTLSEGTAEASLVIAAMGRATPRLKRIMRRRFGLSEEDAEDVLQEVSLVALQKISTVEFPDQWLAGVTQNFCKYLLYERYHRQAVELTAWDLGSPPAQEARAIHIDQKRAFALLPERVRKVLVLRAMGFSCSEIACKTGYSSNSISRVISRGIARLGSCVQTPQRTLPPAAVVSRLVRSWTHPATKRNYRWCLTSFSRWLAAENPAAAVSKLLSLGKSGAEEIVLRYQIFLLAKGYRGSMLRNHLAVLRAVVRTAEECGLVNWQLEVTNICRQRTRAGGEPCGPAR